MIEFGVVDEVVLYFGFDVYLFDGFLCKNVGVVVVVDCNDVGVVGEDFEGDGVDEVVFVVGGDVIVIVVVVGVGVVCKVEFD